MEKKEEIRWNDDVIVKQLVSYAVGCMMGRYSLDRKGLVLANQGDTVERYRELVPESRFEVDDDGIVPLMYDNPELTDNATARFKAWLTAAFGAEKLVENLNYVERALGKPVGEYFAKEFWKDHLKMYQRRPIYWLFSSKPSKGRGKGVAFQCLVYMHRMNVSTVERVRSKYLLPYMDWLEGKRKELQGRAAELTTAERTKLENIIRKIEECREYNDQLRTMGQITLDLDDGVAANYAKLGNVLAKIV